MTDFCIALRQPLTVDLKPLSQLLWQRGLPHRIAEEGGEQVLWVTHPEHAHQVEQVFAALQSGELATPLRTTGRAQHSLFRHRPGAAPVIVSLILLSALGALVAWFDRDYSLLTTLSFYRFSEVNGQLVGAWPHGEVWRLITPLFLHFGVMHLVFNSLWMWELGGMIERRQGKVRILGLTLLVGAGSNIAQAIAGLSLFGGMSGVIYGLLGYILAWNRLRPGQAFPLVRGVAVAMLIWLVLCVFGFSHLLGMGDIANTAHISGLLLGLMLGGGAALLDRRGA